jgi:hypothetical protein
MLHRWHIDWQRLWDRTYEGARNTGAWCERWCERHSATGTWVGAAGAVLAILGAFGVAEWQYMKTVAEANGKVNSLIALVSRSANEFDPLVQEYIRLVRSHDPAAKDFRGINRHVKDIRNQRMIDLANMPIMSWPTVDAYDAFKTYFFTAQNLLESDDPEPLIKAYEGELDRLRKALDAAHK